MHYSYVGLRKTYINIYNLELITDSRVLYGYTLLYVFALSSVTVCTGIEPLKSNPGPEGNVLILIISAKKYAKS